VSRRRTTFGKLQRDRDKQAKQRAKQERRAERAERSDETDDQETAPGPEVDQAKVLAQLADLHAAFDDGRIGFDDFEARREELTSQLRVD
jgi:ATPase subunit of ABC transporter with duplicated ATPase domains